MATEAWEKGTRLRAYCSMTETYIGIQSAFVMLPYNYARKSSCACDDMIADTKVWKLGNGRRKNQGRKGRLRPVHYERTACSVARELLVGVVPSFLGHRFALCYRTVVCLFVLCCLSVTLVHCGQTVGWIKIKLWCCPVSERLAKQLSKKNFRFIRINWKAPMGKFLLS